VSESSLWYGRFVRFYLPGGADRSIDKAYRSFRSRQATGVKEAPTVVRGGASGSWNAAARKWSWTARARAYDAHQAVLVQRAHANAIKKANERHLAVVQNHFGKLLKQTQVTDYSGLTDMGDLLKAAKELILLERLLLGMPLTVEETRTAPVDPAAARAVQESVESTATPEMLAEVFKILDAQGAFADARVGIEHNAR